MSVTALESDHQEAAVTNVPGEPAAATPAYCSTFDSKVNSNSKADAAMAVATTTSSTTDPGGRATTEPDVTTETAGKHEGSQVLSRSQVLMYDRDSLFRLRFEKQSLTVPKVLLEHNDELKILYLDRVYSAADRGAPVAPCDFTKGCWRLRSTVGKGMKLPVAEGPVFGSVSSSLSTEAQANGQNSERCPNSDGFLICTAVEEPVSLLDLKVLQRQENSSALVRYLVLMMLGQPDRVQRLLERLLCELLRAGIVTEQSYNKGLLEFAGMTRVMAETQPATWARLAEFVARTAPAQQQRQQHGQVDGMQLHTPTGVPLSSCSRRQPSDPTREAAAARPGTSAEPCGETIATHLTDKENATFRAVSQDSDVALRQDLSGSLCEEPPERPKTALHGASCNIPLSAAAATEKHNLTPEDTMPSTASSSTVIEIVQSSDQSNRSERANVASRIMKQFRPRLLDARSTNP